jgi:hypothetical protein
MRGYGVGCGMRFTIRRHRLSHRFCPALSPALVQSSTQSSMLHSTLHSTHSSTLSSIQPSTQPSTLPSDHSSIQSSIQHSMPPSIQHSTLHSIQYSVIGTPHSVLFASPKKVPHLCRFRLELHCILDLGGRYVATARTRPVGSHLPYIMFVGKGGCRGCRTLQGTVNLAGLGVKSKWVGWNRRDFRAARG